MNIDHLTVFFMFTLLSQASWKGFILRKKLLAALEFAQCSFSDEEDEFADGMNFGDEFDLDKFVDIDQVRYLWSDY